MAKVELRESDGTVIGTLDTDKTYFFDLVTKWGEKAYKIEFTHPRDPTTHVKDLTKLSGAQLNAR